MPLLCSVVALETEAAAIEAAGEVAKAALSAAQRLTEIGEIVVTWPVKELPKIISVDSMHFHAGSIKQLGKDGLVTVKADGMFAKKRFSVDEQVSFPPTPEAVVKVVWAVLKRQSL